MSDSTDIIRKGACALAIMTKAPSAGQVKTRLSPPLTPDEAAVLSRCFIQDTATILETATRSEFVQRIAVYTPASAASTYRELLSPQFLLVPQRGETFGGRLIAAFEDLFGFGFSSVCLIGSDSPTLPAETITETIRVLAKPDESIVIGPADDGGYYLIALRRFHRDLFEKITWSSELVLAQTLQRAKKMNLNTHLLPRWYDVDDATSLHRLCEQLFGPGKSAHQNSAPATRDYLERLIHREGRERIWPDGAKK